MWSESETIIIIFLQNRIDVESVHDLLVLFCTYMYREKEKNNEALESKDSLHALSMLTQTFCVAKQLLADSNYHHRHQTALVAWVGNDGEMHGNTLIFTFKGIGWL